MYKYEDYKAEILTDEGQREFLKTRDHVSRLLDKTGAVNMACAMSATSGSSWKSMAYVDRLIELGEIVEVKRPNVAGQYRVFVRPGH